MDLFRIALRVAKLTDKEVVDFIRGLDDLDWNEIVLSVIAQCKGGWTEKSPYHYTIQFKTKSDAESARDILTKSGLSVSKISDLILRVGKPLPTTMTASKQGHLSK